MLGVTLDLVHMPVKVIPKFFFEVLLTSRLFTKMTSLLRDRLCHLQPLAEQDDSSNVY